MSVTELLFMISNVSFLCAGMSLMIAILLWFKWEIPQVMAELSGRLIRKPIETETPTKEKAVKDLGRNTSKQVENSQPLNTEETDFFEKNYSDYSTDAPTDLMEENRQTEYQDEAMEATLLTQDNLTEVQVHFREGIPEVQYSSAQDETCLLEDTEPLEEDNLQKNKPNHIKLVRLEEVMLIHTNEMID